MQFLENKEMVKVQELHELI